VMRFESHAHKTIQPLLWLLCHVMRDIHTFTRSLLNSLRARV